MKCSITHIALFLLAAALLAGGCHRTDPEEGTTEEIRFQVSEEWQSGNDTRATVYEGADPYTSSDFLVHAFVGSGTNKYFTADGERIHYDGAKWVFASGAKYYWPASGNLNFFAHFPYNLSGTCCSFDSSPYRQYNNTDGYQHNHPIMVCTDLPVTSSGQASLTEFIYSYVTGQNKAGQGVSGVSLAFHHPFSKMSLQISTAHRAARIHSVTFKSIDRSGRFDCGTQTWSARSKGTGANEDFVVTVDQDVVVNADFSSALTGAPYLLIPQGDFITGQIEVSLTWSGAGSPVTLRFNNPASEWQQGKFYRYTLHLGDEIRFGVTISDWADAGNETLNPANVDFSVTVLDWSNGGGSHLTY